MTQERPQVVVYSRSRGLTAFFQCYYGEYQLIFLDYLDECSVEHSSVSFIFVDCADDALSAQVVERLEALGLMEHVILICPNPDVAFLGTRDALAKAHIKNPGAETWVYLNI